MFSRRTKQTWGGRFLGKIKSASSMIQSMSTQHEESLCIYWEVAVKFLVPWIHTYSLSLITSPPPTPSRFASPVVA